MLVVEVGVDRITQNESYRLLYCSKAGGDEIPWNQIDHWRPKEVVEANFEPCDHPEIWSFRLPTNLDRSLQKLVYPHDQIGEFPDYSQVVNNFLNAPPVSGTATVDVMTCLRDASRNGKHSCVIALPLECLMLSCE
jgi:hypothetical protein